jgi:ubiquinone/menaquinone biosynthesis C-methylase UbiE
MGEFVRVGEFADVDRSGDPDGMVRWMSGQRTGRSRGQSRVLGAAAGERVVDIGCGPGADLGPLGADVGAGGLVVGFDRSEVMARRAAEKGLVTVADGRGLPVRDGVFDAAWIRAVLVHVEDPVGVLREVRRILRPGGRVVAVEPDHGSHIVGPCDAGVFERIRGHRAGTFASPRMGRALKRHMSEAGFDEPRGRAATVQFERLADARKAGGPFDQAAADAVEDGVITAEEASAYIEAIERADREGAFFFAAMSVVVRGTRS